MPVTQPIPEISTGNSVMSQRLRSLGCNRRSWFHFLFALPKGAGSLHNARRILSRVRRVGKVVQAPLAGSLHCIGERRRAVFRPSLRQMMVLQRARPYSSQARPTQSGSCHTPEACVCCVSRAAPRVRVPPIVERRRNKNGRILRPSRDN